MPIKTNFVNYCPLFFENDRLSINGTVTVRERRIYDSTTGALHCLRPEGAMVVSWLNHPTTFGQLKRKSTEAGILLPQLMDLLGFLNLLGSLGRQRRWPNRLLELMHLLHIWRLHKPLYGRAKATLPSLMAQILFVCWPIVLLSTALSLLVGASGVVSFTEALGISTIWNALLIASIYLHEVAHLVVLRIESIPTDIIRHGLRVGLLHRSLDPATQTYLALAGPITGAASCILGSVICKALGLSISYVAISAIALIHLCSLLPWYGDGANLRIALHERKCV